MTYYYDTVCIMLETAWITLQCTLFCLSVQSDKHFSRGYVSSPLPTATEGVELICQLWLILSPQRPPPPSLCSEHSALRLTTSLCRCFSVTPSTELRLLGGLVAEKRTSAQTCTDSLAYRGRQQQQIPANLFVLYCTHQVPVSHHPFPL